MGKNIKIFVIIILTVFISCNTTEPPPEDNRKLTLAFEDASCTEAWITLTTENVQLPAEIKLTTTDSDGNPKSQILNLKSKDSLLYIDSLLPNQTYKFQVSGIGNQESGILSNELSFTTMDTTSHNFTFETWTFGDIGSSTLYDVAIINEQNIWCVGEMNIADTSANGYTTYNAVHWDGNEWNLKRIFFPTVCGSSNLTSYPAKSINIFNNDEIWISSSGDKIAILKDGVQTDKFCLPSNVSMTINKIWGTSSPEGTGNDLYVVGNNGNIARYYNGQWRKIVSGTDLDLFDIEYRKEGNEIFVSGYSIEKSILLKINNYVVEKIWEGEISSGPLPYEGIIYGIYSNNKDLFVASRAGLFREKKFNGLTVKKIAGPTNWYPYDLVGKSGNNIFTICDQSEIFHYNGITYKRIYYDNMKVSRLFTGEVYGNLLVGVGFDVENQVSRKAKIIFGNNN